jgi:hypothetical protein
MSRPVMGRNVSWPGQSCPSSQAGCVAVAGEPVFCHFDPREKSYNSARCRIKISRNDVATQFQAGEVMETLLLEPVETAR